jgi:hypothetical protein
MDKSVRIIYLKVYIYKEGQALAPIIEAKASPVDEKSQKVRMIT